MPGDRLCGEDTHQTTPDHTQFPTPATFKTPSNSSLDAFLIPPLVHVSVASCLSSAGAVVVPPAPHIHAPLPRPHPGSWNPPPNCGYVYHEEWDAMRSAALLYVPMIKRQGRGVGGEDCLRRGMDFAVGSKEARKQGATRVASNILKTIPGRMLDFERSSNIFPLVGNYHSYTSLLVEAWIWSVAVGGPCAYSRIPGATLGYEDWNVECIQDTKGE